MRLFLAETVDPVIDADNAYRQNDRVKIMGRYFHVREVIDRDYVANQWSRQFDGSVDTFAQINSTGFMHTPYIPLQVTELKIDRESFKRDKLDVFKKALKEAVEAGVSDSDLREAFWMEGVRTVMEG